MIELYVFIWGYESDTTASWKKYEMHTSHKTNMAFQAITFHKIDLDATPSIAIIVNIK